MKLITLSFLCSLMLSLGQVLWKKGLMDLGGLAELDISWLRKALLLVSSTYILGGFVLYFLSTMLWFYLLAHFPLSKVYPLLASAYIFGMIFSKMFFNESIPLLSWGGVILILLGVLLISQK